MPIIDEKAAWDILRQYVDDCLEIDTDTLVALYATGSLPGGYYRPGQSDIDAVLIVKNGSEPIWGTSEKPSERLATLNCHYLKRHKIPKDFGPFPLQERELFPPYDLGEDVLTSEIARLKVQGKLVYGTFNLEAVPMPTARDFLAGAQRFEEWWRDAFLKTTPPEAMSPAACVNTILMHLGRFLRIKRGLFEFDKRRIVSAYLDHDPPLTNGTAFRLVEEWLASGTLTEPDTDFLRRFVGELRADMNACLGIIL
jgi:hypothetical protein